jgi:hypothetical protein
MARVDTRPIEDALHQTSATQVQPNGGVVAAVLAAGIGSLVTVYSLF